MRRSILSTGAIARLKRGLSTRQNLLVDFTQVYGSQLFGQALGLLKGFLIARYLRPEGLGIWKSLELILQYHQFTTLGTQNGMSRDTPLWRGRGDAAKAAQVEQTAYGQVFTLPLLASAVVFFASFWPDVGDTMAWSLRLLSAILMLSMLAVLWGRILAARLLFGYLSFLQVMTSIVAFLAVVLLVPGWNIHGYLVGLLITNLFVVIVGYRLLGGIAWRYDWHEAWELIKVGFPIMFVGLLYLLLTTVDRMLILRYLTLTDLGYYGLALMLSQVLGQITEPLGNVLYPRMNEVYGQAGRAEALRNLAIQPTIAIALTMPVLVGAAILFLPDVVRWLLPDYLPGVLPAQVLIVGTTFAGLNVLNTINRQKLYALVQFGAVLLNVGVAVLLLGQGYGLLAVALGTSLSFVFCNTLASFLSLRAMRFGYRKTLSTIACLAAPYAYVIVVAGVGQALVAEHFPEPAARLSAQIVVLLVGALPLLYALWRTSGATFLRLWHSGLERFGR